MSDQETRLRDALRAAGPRSVPDAATLARLRAAAHLAWQAELDRKKRWRRVGVAAALVLAVGIAAPFVLRQTSPPPAAIAQVLASGPGVVLVRGRRASQLDANALAAGDELRAGDGAVALRRKGDNAGGIRVAAGSRVVFRDQGRLELIAGEVYVDTTAGGMSDASPLQVIAGVARIDHVGTQFSVTRSASDVRVAVREGRVRVELGAERAELVRGESVAFPATGGDLRRASVAPDDASWTWAEALAPPLELEGRDLRTVLEVLARESGRQLRFANSDIATQAATTVLHGPALAVPPAEALETLLATSGFLAQPGAPGYLVIAAR